MTFYYSKFDDIEFDGYEEGHPEYQELFISFAIYDGKKLNDEQLDELNECSDLIYKKFAETGYGA